MTRWTRSLSAFSVAAALLASSTLALAQPGPAHRSDGPSVQRGGPGGHAGPGRHAPPPRGHDARDHNPRGHDARDDRRYGGPGHGAHDGRRGAGPDRNWYRGARIPPQYRTHHYVVNNWRGHHLTAPPRGYQWVQNGSDYLLVAVATGLIANIIFSQ